MFPTTDGHQWISVTDAAGESWMFDVTFLTSGFACIYGDGCKSISPKAEENSALGCCVHGAHFTDDDDRDETAAYAALLTADTWQHLGVAAAKGGPFKKKGGGWKTRKHDGACIFLNREGFAGGAGCALHSAAVAFGQKPMDWKPDVCWQVPIRLEIHTDDNGHDTMMVKAWDRRDWGEGGAAFDWWCIESDEAYEHDVPLYKSSEDELRTLVGDLVYERFVAVIEETRRQGPATAVSIG
ncbi:MAG: hypothetical protein R2706_17965 [Acidimicrobiales bacterium]